MPVRTPSPRRCGTGAPGVVGVVVEGRLLHAFRDPFAVSVLDGLSQVLDEIPAGMLLIAQPAGTPERAITQLSATALDAVVFSLCGPDTNPAVDHLAARGIPMLGDGSPADPRITHLALDNRGATVRARAAPDGAGPPAGGAPDDAAAARLPHRARQPGTTSPRRSSPTRATGRWASSTSSVTVARPGAPPALAQTSIPDVEQGAIAARLLLDVPVAQRPTAIVAQSDLLAMGVMRAAEELGLRVPDDLSVTGFDGVELPWFAGTLTTIDQHGGAKGRLMGEMLRSCSTATAPTTRCSAPTCGSGRPPRSRR